MIIIYCDGSCLGNPGKGGWGVIVMVNGETFELYGGESHSTNNRMELTAAIEALKFVDGSTQPIHVYTDSQYVIKGITEWIKGWKKKNYSGVKNPDLWKELDATVNNRNIKWHWVKGHSGNEYNEKVDILAKKGANEC